MRTGLCLIGEIASLHQSGDKFLDGAKIKILRWYLDRLDGGNLVCDYPRASSASTSIVQTFWEWLLSAKVHEDRVAVAVPMSIST